MTRRNSMWMAVLVLLSALAFLPYSDPISPAFAQEKGGLTLKVKPAAPAGREPRPPVDQAQGKMAELIDIERVDVSAFKEVMDILVATYGFPPLLVNGNAFKEEHPEGPNPFDTLISLAPLKRISRANVLKLVLGQFEPANATYLIRPTYVEVTTYENAQPQRQSVSASFVNKPLADALDELANMTGVSIILDARAPNRLTPITAKFREEISLVNAVSILADMTDLKLIIVNNVLYVTAKSNKTKFPDAPLRKEKRDTV